MKKNFLIGTCFLFVSFTSSATLLVNVSTTDASCSGANNGSITVMASGGTAPYQYSINGVSYGSSNIFPDLAAGNYGVFVIDALGETSSQNATVGIGSGPANSLTSIVTCSNELPYYWNGNGYVAAGTYLITLINSDGCDSIATLELTVNPVVTTISNITICANQLPYIWNGNSYPIAGMYQVTLTSSQECDSIAKLSLVVNSVTASTTNITTCSNQLPYTWNGNSYPGAGTYSAILQGSGGCDSVATLNLIVNAVVTSSTDITICASQLPYSWYGQIYNTAGTYNVTYTASSGCDSIATLNLLVITMNEWIGSTNTSWEVPSNWSCGAVPGITSDVIINSGNVVLHANTTINSLSVSSGVNLSVNPGVNLIIIH